ncbi:transcriptional regulator DegU [Alcanivorax sp. S71-1-4]|jgi:DNA-binding NarL/FixJ family response regulator|uniref:response regulator n=1 Tax=Alcanivorax sp. S71-1-4 TaxID=1177159 RepID=UPI00135C1839|nr:response regulator transcription factor [Alcanivorax sp. S71-1-4]KAF0810719.1 transcriptional regulator DegU [Alcanivorax sp. S71-1-4]
MDPILIADDHPLFRAALRQAVAGCFTDAPITEADSLAAVQHLVEAQRSFSLLLLDLHMPGTHGFSGLIYLREQYPQTPLVVISASDEPDIMQRAVNFGANGFIPKSTSLDTMTDALKAVLKGDTWLPVTARQSSATAASASEQELARRITSLTPQQFRVLGMLLEGMANKVIAIELNVSEATVKAHMTAILRKLGARNRTQAVLLLRDIAIDTAHAESTSGA